MANVKFVRYDLANYSILYENGKLAAKGTPATINQYLQDFLKIDVRENGGACFLGQDPTEDNVAESLESVEAFIHAKNIETAEALRKVAEELIDRANAIDPNYKTTSITR